MFDKGVPSWEEFSFQVRRSLNIRKESKILIKYKTLEKIRFFMSFMNSNPNFDYQNIPIEFKNIIYTSKYESWRKNSSYYKIYEKYIKPDREFFARIVNATAIPNYPVWNLEMTYFGKDEIQNIQEDEDFQYFPIQVFEDLQNKTVSIFALENNKNSKGQKIEKFSIRNNLNIFPNKKRNVASLKLEQNSIFESYVKFLDEINNENESSSFYKNTFELEIDFSVKCKNPDYIKPFLNKKTINEYNLLYYRDLSQFIGKFISDTNIEALTYRYLFKSGFFLPDFTFKNNFLLRIKKKKRNLKFEDLTLFFKNWNYQTIVYELKDEIIIQEYLLPNFRYSLENIYLNDLFENLEIDFEFMVYNSDY